MGMLQCFLYLFQRVVCSPRRAIFFVFRVLPMRVPVPLLLLDVVQVKTTQFFYPPPSPLALAPTLTPDHLGTFC